MRINSNTADTIYYVSFKLFPIHPPSNPGDITFSGPVPPSLSLLHLVKNWDFKPFVAKKGKKTIVFYHHRFSCPPLRHHKVRSLRPRGWMGLIENNLTDTLTFLIFLPCWSQCSNSMSKCTKNINNIFYFRYKENMLQLSNEGEMLKKSLVEHRAENASLCEQIASLTERLSIAEDARWVTSSSTNRITRHIIINQSHASKYLASRNVSPSHLQCRISNVVNLTKR